MLLSTYPIGVRKDGFIRLIPEDGSNGIAATIMADGCLKKTKDKSSVGKP
jgi:hypothetical protein